MFVFFSIDPQTLHWIKTALLIARYYGKLYKPQFANNVIGPMNSVLKVN